MTRHGQGHVFAFWDELTKEEQRHLVEDLQTINVSEMTDMFTKANDKSLQLNTKVNNSKNKINPNIIIKTSTD